MYFGGDREPADRAAADVGQHGSRRHFPAGRLFVFVGRRQRFNLAGEHHFSRRAQEFAVLAGITSSTAASFFFAISATHSGLFFRASTESIS